MRNLRNPVVALIIFGMLVSLSALIYNNFEDAYSLQESGTQTVEINNTNQTSNIMEQFERLNLIEGMNQISVNIQKIGTPSAGLTDILGSLAGVGIGILKSVTGIVTIIPSIFLIVASYYQIPPIVYVGLAAIFSVTIGFILLSAYIGRDV